MRDQGKLEWAGEEFYRCLNCLEPASSCDGECKRYEDTDSGRKLFLSLKKKKKEYEEITSQ